MVVELAGISAPVVQSRDDTPLSYFFGGQTWLRATSVTTNGQLAIVEQILDPGLGSPYHMHRNEDEMFYIIEGEVRFVSEGGSWRGGAGTYAFLPRNVPHGFEVVGDVPAHFLILVTPAGFEAFVAELAEPAPAPPDMPRVMEAASRFELKILGPLPV